MRADANLANTCEDPRLILVESLSNACIELYDHYGVSLRPVADIGATSVSTLGFVALISMSNPEVKLSIALQTQRDVLQESFPAEEHAADDRGLQDWIGELSNQLAGRVKNKMLVTGCSLDLGIPTVIQGENMHLDLPRRSEISEYSFAAESDQLVKLSLSTMIDSYFRLCSQPKGNQAIESMDEGEMLFF